MQANGKDRWSGEVQGHENNVYNPSRPESANENGKGSGQQEWQNGRVRNQSQSSDRIKADVHRADESYPLFREHSKDVLIGQRFGISTDGVHGQGDNQLKTLSQSMSPIQKREPGLKSALDSSHWQAKREEGEKSKSATLHRVELSGVDDQPPSTTKDFRPEKRSFINYLADQGPRSGANYPFLARAPSESPRDAQNGLGVKSSIETSQNNQHYSSQTPNAMDFTRDSKYPASKPSELDMMRVNGDTPTKHMSSFLWRTARDSPRLNIPPQSKSTDPMIGSHSGAGLDLPEQSKSSLGLRLDENRRGRISPLPQAVQGAQARLEGPATEPNIKNEFARIFPGIGSGVGSNMNTPAPPESATPISIPSSPTARTEDVERGAPFRGRGDFMELIKPASTGRKGMRRSRKVKDEEGKAENSLPHRTEEGGARGTKRPRQGQQIHHHHSRAYQ